MVNSLSLGSYLACYSVMFYAPIIVYMELIKGNRGRLEGSGFLSRFCAFYILGVWGGGSREKGFCAFWQEIIPTL